MKEKFIILRNKTPKTRDIFLGPAMQTLEKFDLLNEAKSVNLSVETEEINRSRIRSIASNEEIVAIAPVMPMKLISPVSAQFKPEPQTINSVSWGIKAVAADSSAFSGQGITIAVLDTGIDSTHNAFSGVSLIEKDFTGEGNGDKNGHGTHCAGTIFGRTSEQGVRIGIATGVKKAFIGKVLGEKGGGSSEMIVSAIQWAVQEGANIISMSLGIDFPGYIKQLEERGYPIEIAATKALEGYRVNVLLFERLASLVRLQSEQNMSNSSIIVAAAGNESKRDQNPEFEIAVSPPAVSEGIISVAALEQSGSKYSIANFSNTGAGIAAPGVNIVSARAGGGLVSYSGTSMATPHVAGVAALWAEKIKNGERLSSLQLTARLLGSATYLGLNSNIDPFDIGTGLVQAPQS